jgi:hypothetical protein
MQTNAFKASDQLHRALDARQASRQQHKKHIDTSDGESSRASPARKICKAGGEPCSQDGVASENGLVRVAALPAYRVVHRCLLDLCLQDDGYNHAVDRGSLAENDTAWAGGLRCHSANGVLSPLHFTHGASRKTL